MKKLVKKISIIVICLSLFSGINSCGKYEDGPMISLSTKESRLTKRFWLLKKIDSELTEKNRLIFNKEGVFKRLMNHYDGGYYSSVIGTWEWGDEKETILINLDNNRNEMVYTILRLTKKEFNFSNEDGEVWELEEDND